MIISAAAACVPWAAAAQGRRTHQRCKCSSDARPCHRIGRPHLRVPAVPKSREREPGRSWAGPSLAAAHCTALLLLLLLLLRVGSCLRACPPLVVSNTSHQQLLCTRRVVIASLTRSLARSHPTARAVTQGAWAEGGERRLRGGVWRRQPEPVAARGGQRPRPPPLR
eukprot:COSAG01_NODE_2633_length_7333_cov_89.156760_11_plen_167_part_00